MLTTANHLNYQQKINNGSFYTPPELVNHVWELINPFLTKNTVILDTSAGKGSFFISRKEKDLLLTAADNDTLAVDYLKENFPSLRVIHKNALTNIKRTEYGIKDNQKLIIIGNPPYNDITSLKARKLKESTQNNLVIDPQIKSRDLGISFLRSYYQLKADYVCVLHPLKSKKTYPYPSYKNPIILPCSFVAGSAYSVKDQLIEIQKKIIANEPIFQRKNDKIPALWFLLPTAYLPEPFISSWCFECFGFIREALRHGIIKNRHDARFWGLKEKKALCGDCLEKRLGKCQ